MNEDPYQVACAGCAASLCLWSLSLKKLLCSLMAFCRRAVLTPSTQFSTRARTFTATPVRGYKKIQINISYLLDVYRIIQFLRVEILLSDSQSVSCSSDTVCGPKRNKKRLFGNPNKLFTSHNRSESLSLPLAFSISPRTMYWAPMMGLKGSTNMVWMTTWCSFEAC